MLSVSWLRLAAVLALTGPVFALPSLRPSGGFAAACNGQDYQLQTGQFEAFFGPGRIVFRSKRERMELRYAGASQITPQPEGKLPGVVNRIVAADKGGACSGSPTYARLTYPDLYPGITAHFDSGGDELKSVYEVAAGSSVDAIRLVAQGTSSVRVNEAGELELAAEAGVWREQRPRSWQVVNGVARPVSVTWRVRSDGSIGFRAAPYDRRAPLVIDPAFRYNTYLANGTSSTFAVATSTAVDASGNVYVAGYVEGSGLGGTTTNSTGGSVDAFLLKLDATGALVFSTYYGGSRDDRALAVAIDANGLPWIAGSSGSYDLPLANAFQPFFGGYRNAFVAQFSTSGSLLFSTFLGGSGPDVANGLATDSSGNIYVTGDTQSSNFRVQQAFQSQWGGGQDAFVVKINSANALVYATYLGGALNDHAAAIAVDGAGNAYIAGETFSANFPIRSAYQSSLKGAADAFVTKLDPNGALVSSTYLGGSGGSYWVPEQVNAIALDAQGSVYAAGTTGSPDFPAAAGATLALSGPSDAFVVKMNNSLSAISYSSLIGGSGAESAAALVVDRFGAAAITGSTSSLDFPGNQPLQTRSASAQDGYDAFVTIVNPSGSATYFASTFGGTGNDSANGLAFDGNGGLYLVGQTLVARLFPDQRLPFGHTGGTGLFCRQGCAR